MKGKNTQRLMNNNIGNSQILKNKKKHRYLKSLNIQGKQEAIKNKKIKVFSISTTQDIN